MVDSVTLVTLNVSFFWLHFSFCFVELMCDISLAIFPLQCAVRMIVVILFFFIPFLIIRNLYHFKSTVQLYRLNQTVKTIPFIKWLTEIFSCIITNSYKWIYVIWSPITIGGQCLFAYLRINCESEWSKPMSSLLKPRAKHLSSTVSSNYFKENFFSSWRREKKKDLTDESHAIKLLFGWSHCGLNNTDLNVYLIRLMKREVNSLELYRALNVLTSSYNEKRNSKWFQLNWELAAYCEQWPYVERSESPFRKCNFSVVSYAYGSDINIDRPSSILFIDIRIRYAFTISA